MCGAGENRKAPLAPEWSEVIYLATRKWRPCEDMSQAPHWMASYEELAAFKQIKSSAAQMRWAEHNGRFLSRTYPGGARVDSSNYMPHPFWDVGVQMVALNFQTQSTLPMQANTGLFRANGGCGYVLKPSMLCSHLPERIWDQESVTVGRISLLWAEQLPQPGADVECHTHTPADAAKDFHPPPPELAAGAGVLLLLNSDRLRPYVTVECFGGEFGGAASSLKAIVHGAVFRSDWADSGLSPAWHQTVEVAASHVSCAFLRFCVYNRASSGSSARQERGSSAQDELVAIEVVPFWALRPGYRVLQLRDPHGSPLLLSRLLVEIELREDNLPQKTVRETYQAGERPQRQVSMAQTSAEARDEWGVIGFKKKKKLINENAGTVRLTVSRLGGGDAQALVFYTTEDGTALAGYDYEPQSGHLFFLKGQKTKEIKILIIDDDEIEADKSFTVRLAQPENCTLHRSRQSVRVTVLDDDLNIVQEIKRTSWWNYTEFFMIFYALLLQDVVELALIIASQDHEAAGAPMFLPPQDVEYTFSVANLVLFLYFTLDMVLTTCEKGRRYIFSIRSLLDFIATITLVPVMYPVQDVFEAGVSEEMKELFTRGVFARVSRVARLASRMGRITKGLATLTRGTLNLLLNNAAKVPMLAKFFGVSDDAAAAAKKRADEIRRFKAAEGNTDLREDSFKVVYI